MNIRRFLGITGLAAAAFAAPSAFSALAWAEPQPTAPPGEASILPPRAGAVQKPVYAPERLEWKKGGPIPPGYRPSTELRTGVIITGAVTLGLFWTAAAGGGLYGFTACGDGKCRLQFAPLFVPVVGPFIYMGVDNSHMPPQLDPIFAVNGALQTAGAFMLIYGLVSRRDVLVRSDKVLGTPVRWQPTVMATGQSGTGLGFRGTW